MDHFYITRNKWNGRNLVIEVAMIANCDRWSLDEALPILRAIPAAWEFAVKKIATVEAEYEEAIKQGMAARFSFITI